MQTGTSLYLDEVDLGEAVIAARLLDVEDGDDIFVVKVSEELHFAQGS
jgi:hypothetical protein